MGLSKEAIKEFKQAYLDEFNEEISDDEAQEMGERLIALFKIICRPIPQRETEIPVIHTDTFDSADWGSIMRYP